MKLLLSVTVCALIALSFSKSANAYCNIPAPRAERAGGTTIQPGWLAALNHTIECNRPENQGGYVQPDPQEQYNRELLEEQRRQTQIMQDLYDRQNNGYPRSGYPR